ncbi:hypothetical protein F4777DRAFT_154627 [Nemania sp. FL0916]|nr:hypothetical protein F4777DRAFT_154627 [Nemania sp. FL0916]
MVSQDYDEIFLNCGKFGPGYVNYIQGKKKKEKAFLTMHGYGPYDIFDGDALKEVGKIVLAYGLQSCNKELIESLTAVLEKGIRRTWLSTVATFKTARTPSTIELIQAIDAPLKLKYKPMRSPELVSLRITHNGASSMRT